RHRSDLPRQGLLPRRRRGRRQGLPPAAGGARADRPRRDRPLRLPQPRVPGRAPRARLGPRPPHAPLPRRGRRPRRLGDARPAAALEPAGGEDGRPARREPARRLRPAPLQGRLSQGGARADREQGQGPQGRAAGARGAGGATRRPRCRAGGEPGREPLMPRGIWSGTLSFGLVNVPVRLVSAVRDLDLHFHQLHSKDKARIEVRRWCTKEDKEVDWDEIAHAYERKNGKDVVLTDEELAAVEPRKTRTIGIEEFVDLEEIDPLLFDHPY